MMKSIRTAFSALALLLGAAGAASLHAEVTAIRAGQLVDPSNASIAVNQVILVEGGKITAVGPASSVAIPANAQVVDLSKRAVMPGFFGLPA